MAWTNDELRRIGEADELELTAAGRTVTIWVVRAGGRLYVRSWRGRSGGWFGRAQGAGRGRITAAGIDRDVQFVERHEADDAVDDAYRTKYARYPSYVEPMVAPDARATTLELVPHSEEPA